MSHLNPFYLFQIFRLLDVRRVRDKEAEVAGPYKVPVSGNFFQRYKTIISISYSEDIFIIVIVMYPMPSLTHMLDILGKSNKGVAVIIRVGVMSVSNMCRLI